MKKRIKDLTIEEQINICKQQHECVCCPLINVCGKLPYYIENEKDLEKDIKAWKKQKWITKRNVYKDMKQSLVLKNWKQSRSPSITSKWLQPGTPI